MDPHVSEPSLQKTSPLTDPAAVYQLTSEVSAQAAMLTSHQQQLQCLTSVTEELVKTLQALRLTTPSAYPPVPEPQPISSNLNISTANPQLSFPEKFDGFPDKCKGFLLQCSQWLYTTDNSRVSFICSLLTGRALDVGRIVWEGGSMSFPSFTDFLRQLREVFEHCWWQRGRRTTARAPSREGHGSWLLSHFPHPCSPDRLG